MSKTWFVTGAGRGIGAEVVKAALAAGDRVVATARDSGKLQAVFNAGSDQLLTAQLDVTDPRQAEAAVRAATDRFGVVDVLVNNAGYGQLGAFEEQEPEQAEKQFATNVFGVLNVTRAVLPVMRQQRAGRILNISSIAGVRGGQGGTLYSASKFAVEGFSESLALEVAQFGIAVTLIEPGYFRTDFLDGSSVEHGRKTIADYSNFSAALRAALLAKNHQQPGDPAKLADVIVHLAAHDSPPLRFAAGTDAVQAIAAKLEALRTEFDQWRDLSITTDATGLTP
ncbi:oxidoreductase [Paraburkholderia domus]|uniref:oxidoreductase n=1 Tax=Paraburkholderia domus TaxID=2793075 RepID=UPI001B023974|nr:oxidoreductase [Paraburkholderia domus]CAE6841663.1 3-oxoacyl-[acyl-carrier-protein] reductase FabG [Paraburkholderia domus]